MENIGEFAGELGGALRSFVYELASIWLLIQVALIVLAGFLGTLFAKLIKARLDLVALTMGWPAWLRLLVRLVADNLGTIFFILLLVVARAGLLAATPLPARCFPSVWAKR